MSTVTTTAPWQADLAGLALTASFTPPHDFSETDHATWNDIVSLHRPNRAKQLVPMFERGLEALGLDAPKIPSLDTVNERLSARTGWRGVFVKGLEAGPSFFGLLRQRLFPIGNFVRDRRDLNYTPAPDIVHDLYGHVPFYADPAYADFNLRFAELAAPHLNDPKRLRMLERFFWFTLEFGLVATPHGLRIFGAGIASSVGECVYALSDGPELLPFDVARICAQEFRIDEMQKRLFVMKSVDQLYACLPELEQALRR